MPGGHGSTVVDEHRDIGTFSMRISETIVLKGVLVFGRQDLMLVNVLHSALRRLGDNVMQRSMG
jgi:hypothetical protein